ncbi:MAG: septal ring lytic transglycosylase RlpA family protein [Proteobacteria bacterium]|nr:septal ring lytic transglycosylase RlpA family protein [Pseudomonadota bacterium]
MHALLLVALAAILALSGCAYIPNLGSQGIYSEAPGRNDGKRLQANSEQPSRARVTYQKGPGFVDPKIQPYSIKGVTYWPIQSGLGYNEVGTASWYGIDFHGKKTATGEVYDMFGVSAAHKTLPLGTKVRVTNLENGREIELTVNDRGPFIDGRIIDLSYASARLLGMADNGVAKVRVEGVSDNPAIASANAKNGAKPVVLASNEAQRRRPQQRADEKASGRVVERDIVERNIIEEPARPQAQAKPPVQVAESRPRQAPKASAKAASAPEPRNEAPAAVSGKFAVQVGAFAQDDNARRVQKRLVESGYGNAKITRVVRGGKEFLAVQAGAFQEREKAEDALRVLRMEFPASFISSGA